MNKLIGKSARIGSLSLDAWSEMYIAVRWIVTEELPEFHYQTKPHHSSLAQLALIGSCQLMEVMFFSSVRKWLSDNQEVSYGIQEGYSKVGFRTALNEWPVILFGRKFEFDTEPFRSAEKLIKRRNSTVHKTSSLTSLEMARSALYTGVLASREMYGYFYSEKEFRYEKVLQKYPLPDSKLFYDVELIDVPWRKD